MSDEVWEQVYDRLAELIEQHRTTLIFVNTRRHGRARGAPPVRAARRGARRRAPRQPRQGAAARRRAAAEARRAEGAGRHRLARARHRHRRRRPRLPARLAALDRDASCSASAARATRSAARRRAGCSRCRATSWSSARRCSTRVRRGELDRLRIPEQPLDVLAQQIVAEVAAREWSEDELFALVRRAWPYRAAGARGVRRRRRACWPRASPPGAAGAARYLHHDAVNRVLRGRRGARLTALTSGGTIPDNADYQVLLEPREPRSSAP